MRKSPFRIDRFCHSLFRSSNSSPRSVNSCNVGVGVARSVNFDYDLSRRLTLARLASYLDYLPAKKFFSTRACPTHCAGFVSQHRLPPAVSLCLSSCLSSHLSSSPSIAIPTLGKVRVFCWEGSSGSSTSHSDPSAIGSRVYVYHRVRAIRITSITTQKKKTHVCHPEAAVPPYTDAHSHTQIQYWRSPHPPSPATPETQTFYPTPLVFLFSRRPLATIIF